MRPPFYMMDASVLNDKPYFCHRHQEIQVTSCSFDNDLSYHCISHPFSHPVLLRRTSAYLAQRKNKHHVLMSSLFHATKLSCRIGMGMGMGMGPALLLLRTCQNGTYSVLKIDSYHSMPLKWGILANLRI